MLRELQPRPPPALCSLSCAKARAGPIADLTYLGKNRLKADLRANQLIRLKRSACVIVALCVASAAAQAQYSVTVDPKLPLAATASLDLSASLGKERTVFVRGVPWGLKSQVDAPSCDARPLIRRGRSQWKVPADCSRVSWTVRFHAAEPGTVDAAEQKSLYFGRTRWWLLSEPTALLRLEGDTAPSSLSVEFAGALQWQRGATAITGGRWRVPSVNNAPGFYVFGNLQTFEHRIGGVQILHVADDIERVQRLDLVKSQEAAWRYLSQITPTPADTSTEDQALLVVWLGRREPKQAGGAAGNRSFIANYFMQPEALPRARTLLILSHEQQHELVDMVRGDRPPLPLWAAESLAQYYALKAIARSGLDPEAVAKVRREFVDPTRPVTAGLLDWQRRHANGNPAAYPMFYEQGATFWALVDESLSRATAGRRTLDDLMPELITAEFSTGGQLPATFVGRLRSEAGESVELLLSKYVGREP